MKMRWFGFAALACLLAAASAVFAQNPDITGIAHVAYRVSNLDKELDFLHKLGYEESFAFQNKEGKTSEVFVKINDTQFFEVYPQTEPAQELGWMHICYESGDLNALYKTLVAHGLTPRPVEKAGAGNLISSLKDPEGRVTEFTQYMPGSKHTLDRGKHLGANRVADAIAGVSLPEPDMAVAEKFYASGLGFATRQTQMGVRVQVTGKPMPWLILRSASGSAKPVLVFQVADTAAALKQLQAAGLNPEQHGRRILVSDPDGNLIAFMQTRMR